MASTRAPFLSTKYGGYYHSQVPKEDEELTHVGPGTPGGEYLRRFWQPVCYADELGDTPVGLKILGEELVAFRDFSGRIGLGGGPLPPSRHLAGVRAGVGAGHPLLLPRLAV